MTKKNIILLITIAVIIILIGYLEMTKPASTNSNQANVPTALGQAPELANIAGFINTPNNAPISIKELIGKKVILVDFWTYSCINCKRTQPYLNDWYKKYKGDGLEIIGVHTPEFEFEKVYANVAKAVTAEQIKYPVVLDNTFATWQAYGNKYWPRKYLIDITGKIVYDKIGEGGYAETEAKIREALAERAKTLGEKDLLPATAQSKIVITEPGPDLINTDFSKIKSPEIYFGSARQDKANNITIKGTWETTGEFIKNISAPAEIEYEYEARDVFMVAAADTPVPVGFYIDGVDRGGEVVEGENLYLVHSDSDYGKHKLIIKAKKPGLRLYTLTFN